MESISIQRRLAFDIDSILSQWSAVLSDQRWRTRFLYDHYTNEKWFQKALRQEAHANEAFAQRLSWIIISRIVSTGVCERRGRQPDRELRNWLIAAYELLALCFLIEPGSPPCVIARAILNSTQMLIPDWQPARSDDSGAVIFAEASRIIPQLKDGRFCVAAEPYTPFFAHTALQAGFKRILCALEQANVMGHYARTRRFNLVEHERSFVAVIRSLHASNPDRFATGAKILAFDFNRHVVDFVLHDLQSLARKPN